MKDNPRAIDFYNKLELKIFEKTDTHFIPALVT